MGSTFVKSHRHSADEGFHSCGRLVVGGPEASTNVLVVKDLNFKGKVFLELKVTSLRS